MSRKGSGEHVPRQGVGLAPLAARDGAASNACIPAALPLGVLHNQAQGGIAA